MSSGLIIMLEIFGVLGAVLLLGARELWLLRRDKKQLADSHSSKRQRSDQ